LLIFGPPGSGKGTYASRLHLELGFPVIATGDIFREMVKEEVDLKNTIERYMGQGELVPDNIVNQVVKERLSKEDCKRGYILDGYPRTIDQAKAAESFTNFGAIIHLVVPEWIVVERLSSRRICQKCGHVYNIRFLKPKKEGICDICGSQIYQRIDDTPKVIQERLGVYETQTQPLLEFYREKIPFVEFKCERIDIPPEVAVREILKKLRKLKLN
jgi:adenylate kinase